MLLHVASHAVAADPALGIKDRSSVLYHNSQGVTAETKGSWRCT